MHYPHIPRSSHSDDIFSYSVQDPYRDLETHSDTTREFITSQQSLFSSFISSYPHRDDLKESLTKMYDYPRTSTPFKRGDFYYYFHNSGLQPQSILYRSSDLTSPPSVFFDPNTLSADGTVSLSTYSFSPCGTYFAYALSDGGSDWKTLHVLSCLSLEPTQIEIKWLKFTSIEWSVSPLGFFYKKYPPPSTDQTPGTETDSNVNAAVYFYSMNTGKETEVYRDDDHPTYHFGIETSECKRYAILSVSESCDPENQVYVRDVSQLLESGDKGLNGWTIIRSDFSAEFTYITNVQDVFYFKTSLDAEKYRLVSITLSDPTKITSIIPESDSVLEFVDYAKGAFICGYLHHVKHVFRIFTLDGRDITQDHPLPCPIGSIVQSVSSRYDSSEIFYYLASYISPGIIYRYDVETKSAEVWKEILVDGHDKDAYQVEQVFVENGGVRVPMYIIQLKEDGERRVKPCLMYGYGGFNISITPSFSVNFLTFVRHFGGRVAVCNLRGGAEYGSQWNKDGKLSNKQNVFSDFHVCAEYLISNGYTSRDKMVWNGGSNGGLLVMASYLQRPDLVGCVLGEVGVYDVIRFWRFTIGYAWVSDYGDPEKVEKDLKTVLGYSPLHNVPSARVVEGEDLKEKREWAEGEWGGTSVLLLTGDHDDRVVPLHSFKMISALQYAATGGKTAEGVVKIGDHGKKGVYMTRLETRAGHGAGKSLQQRIQETVEKFAFAAQVCGFTYHP